MNGYLIAAHDVELGNIVMNADKILGTVVAREFYAGHYRFTLAPIPGHSTEYSTLKLKRNGSVKVSRR